MTGDALLMETRCAAPASDRAEVGPECPETTLCPDSCVRLASGDKPSPATADSFSASASSDITPPGFLVSAAPR